TRDPSFPFLPLSSRPSSPIHTDLPHTCHSLPFHIPNFGHAPSILEALPVALFLAPLHAVLPSLSPNYLSFIILSGQKSCLFLPLPVLRTTSFSLSTIIFLPFFPFLEMSAIFFCKFPFKLTFLLQLKGLHRG
uniref:Uncharacterized protein n=1 Tax=Monodon monoceros TaxID=40151 RepID=A0A8C6F6Z0_MONMO